MDHIVLAAQDGIAEQRIAPQARQRLAVEEMASTERRPERRPVRG